MIDVKKSWDKISERYIKRYGISTDIVHYGPLCPGEDRLQLLGNIAGLKVLDMGCGCGQNAIALAKLGAVLTGVDFSAGQLDQARALAAEENFEIDFVQSDVTRLINFADESFDLVISACAIAFVENIIGAFSEAFRVLRPGGIFILSDMHPLQYILDETDDGVLFNHRYPFAPILLKWRWDFEAGSKDRQLSAGFQHYVRSISHYHNTLVNAGFVVTKILEPEPTLNSPHFGFSREIWNEYRYTAERLPITFIMKCQKP